MKSFLYNCWFLFGVRLLIGGIFLYAGIIKVIAAQEFADSISSFKILPDSTVNLLALALPPFEILLGLMLMFGVKARLGAFGVSILCVIFALALGQALIRGLNVDCGCFGQGEPSPWKTWGALGRDILLLAASLWIWIRNAAIPAKVS